MPRPLLSDGATIRYGAIILLKDNDGWGKNKILHVMFFTEQSDEYIPGGFC